MSTVVSEVSEWGKGSVEWTINNWNVDFDWLKTYATCPIDIRNTDNTALIKLQFLFKPIAESNVKTVGTDCYYGTDDFLNLCLEHLSGAKLPLALRVDVSSNHVHLPESENATDADATHQHIRVEIDNTNFGIVRKRILSLGYTTRDQYQEVIDMQNYSQPPILKFSFNVTVLKFGEPTAVGAENYAAGATGVDYSLAEASIIRDLSAMFSAEDNMADLKLETKDNFTLSGHRFILSARSPVFRKMIEEKLKQNGFNGSLQLSSVNAKPLMVVLHWMYTGGLHQNAAKFMEEVLKICIDFEIADLLKILDKKLITVCTTENMFDLFKVAQLNGMESAKESISEFIKENIGKT